MFMGRALLDGLLFSLLFGFMITLIQVINPRLELHNYPPAIRALLGLFFWEDPGGPGHHNG